MTIREQLRNAMPPPAPLWGSLRKPGEPPAPTLEEWVERIARGSTPVREYVDGKFQPWIETPAAAELALRRVG